MKISIRLLWFALIIPVVIGISSCDKKTTIDNVRGTVKFSLNLPNEIDQAKSGISSDSAMMSYQILVSVEDPSGNPVLTDELIPIYAFGADFVSEEIEILAGDYMLTKFMVINPSGEVIFAAPVAGSPLAYLTNKPLPINFTIYPGQSTRIIPEVLIVGDHTPGEFGYASFGIQIIKSLDFWTVCFLDNPLIMAPVQFTSARLTVHAEDGWFYSFYLEAGLNHIIIRGGSKFYIFILEKEGYMTQKLQFSAGELIEATKDNPLVLKIPWGNLLQSLVLQPGPEAGKDAMISNLQPEMNFGDHKYFEATFLTEPLLTVMRTNNSLIFFNLDSLPDQAKIQNVTLRLSYEFPIIYDSTIITNNYLTPGLVWFGGVLQQIVEPWDEYQVTWNNQPKTIEANQVYISPFIRNVNFIEVDVTSLFVNPTITDPAVYPNYGMLFRQWPSDQFPGFRFASSDFPEPGMRPKLTVFYSL